MEFTEEKPVSTFSRIISWLLIIHLSLLPPAQVLSQTIVVDNTAAANHRATLDTAANGTPIVNIANPSAKGISHNKFSHFNVDSAGVVLNNSRQITTSQQAGYISGKYPIKRPVQTLSSTK